MDENTRTALYHSQVIDLTTTGRRTGRPRRIEIFLHEQDGQLFISGMPRADRTRDWIHNITAERRVAVGRDQRVRRDLRLLHGRRFAANSAIWRALRVLMRSHVCDCKRRRVAAPA